MMDRRQFAKTTALGAGLVIAAPALALADPEAEYRSQSVHTRRRHAWPDHARILSLMAAGLAATLDASLRLREPGGPVTERAVHWWETPFYLTDRELAGGPTDAVQYQEAVRALVNQAHYVGLTKLYPNESRYDPWSVAEVRYGRAIARAQVERQHLRHRWSLSWMGA